MGGGVGDSANRTNPLSEARRQDPLGRAQKSLADFKAHWEQHGVCPSSVPLVQSDPTQPHRNWFPEPDWISGWTAFEVFRLQTEPYQWAPPIARICATIADQFDRDTAGTNYVFDALPPTHELLTDFVLGSNQWFRVLHHLLTLEGAEGIEGWEDLVSDLYNWLGPEDHLRIRAMDVLDNAMTLSWPWHDISLPEAKQEPVWSFPKAMAWIATRDYLALARIGIFRQPTDGDEAVATDGVCSYNTEALGWLHTTIAYTKCKCGAIKSYGYAAFQHCTCISVAWEELVHFNGGLTSETPELVFNLQEGWLSMTWQEGADKLRFLRRDILDRWPAPPTSQIVAPAIEHSTGSGESECREWLVKQFAGDPERRRSKSDFRAAALAEFSGRLSERGFNLRVWPELARDHGRDGAGAKKKS